MFDLVFKNGSEAETDSRRVAKAFGKLHKNVIQEIENLDCPADFARLNFQLCYEINELANGKPVKYYRISESGAMLLIMGFTGSEAVAVKLAFIEAFKEMRGKIANLRELYGLLSLRDAKAAEASDCGRGLAHWAREKTRLDMMIRRCEKLLQLPLDLQESEDGGED